MARARGADRRPGPPRGSAPLPQRTGPGPVPGLPRHPLTGIAADLVASGLRAGAFRPVVDRLFPLEEIVRAHRHLESSTRVGKAVVTVGH
ncbi:zinc-binding dehydrogenase [Streptomyces goshikiensis]|uniref:zinc-binding dehydrogenase n=1 Tax=Streptomyces goshikiensis TaxID=1942 RepID=UPI00331F50B9